ncbi:MAG: ATP-binding protein [Candidatus Methanofastidiosia archaeon]
MKEIAVISGKGGTGKTTLVAAFAGLSKDMVLADCDVDASNLHLILTPKVIKKREFKGSKTAEIDYEACTKCNICHDNCRFDAINKKMEVQKELCEGCGVCVYMCPVNAISLKEKVSGCWMMSETRFGFLSHAHLHFGEEGTGKLVTVVRQNATKLAEKYSKNIVLIDGPPGTGCPVIATIVGTSLILIVCEPTLSGMWDMERVIELAGQLNVACVVCINKYDINGSITRRIEDYCNKHCIEVVGKIPYTKEVVNAMLQEKSLSELEDCHLLEDVKAIWEKLLKKMKISRQINSKENR